MAKCRLHSFSALKLTLLAATLSASAAAVFAQAPQEFDAANRLYEQGKFSEAKQHYESLVRGGNFSGNLFYNLGNTEWKLGNPGAAALDYERALALEPSHPEAHANLQFVRNQTGAKIEAQRWWQRLFLDLAANSYAIMAAVAGWAAVFCIAAILFGMRSETGMLPLAAVVCALIFLYAMGGIYLAEKNGARAIVTAQRSEARFAPADTASLADTLPTASHVRVLRELGAWTYCELPSNARAWLASNTIQRLKPGS